MRVFLIALALVATPAAAQQAPAANAQPALARMLGALWRPVPPEEGRTADALFAAACDGAIAELTALDEAMPAEITPQALAAIRAPRGLIIVPADDDPNRGFLFANAQLADVTSGVAAFTAVDPNQGRVDFTDAGGRVTQLQVGTAGGRPVMRILRPSGEALLYVGCAATTAG